jgi:HEPN domain-containing protein
MDRNNKIAYWIHSSEEDAEAMVHMYNAGHFTWALFLGHIVIEKILKASVLKNTNANPPFTHDLNRIAEKANLSLSDENVKFLDIVSTFNIRARYDDYKREFSSRCTKTYTENMIKQIKDFVTWIKKSF